MHDNSSEDTFFMMNSKLAKQLALDFPLIQAPLSGGPSTPELVAAVSNAGALGSLGAAYLSPAMIEASILEIKKLTKHSFNVNLFAPTQIPTVTETEIKTALSATKIYRDELALNEPTLTPPYQENFLDQVAVILKHRPAVFSFTFGLVDTKILTECRRLDIITIGTATTVEDAIALQESGVDAVVAQGAEAGGHRGLFDADQRDLLIGTHELTRSMKRVITIPIIASGGIMDGKGIADVLSLGADAAQLGTAFLTCDEAGTNKAYRDALLNPNHKPTRITRVFSGRPARGIENRFMTEMEAKSNTVLPYPIQNALTRDIRKRAAELGHSDYLSLWAGEGVAHLRMMKTATLVATLKKETELALEQEKHT